MQRNRGNLRAFCVGIVILTGMVLAPYAASAQGTVAPKAIRGVTIAVDPHQVRQGQSFLVDVGFTVQDGMHLQAHKPLQDYLIGTELQAPAAKGITWQGARYPAGQQRQDRTLGSLLEYTGQINIRLPGVVARDAEVGQREIVLRLRYQACNDKGTCLPPEDVAIPVSFEVVQGGPAGVANAGASGVSGWVQANGPPAARSSAPAVTAKAASDGYLAWQPFSAARLAESDRQRQDGADRLYCGLVSELQVRMSIWR